MWVDARGLNSVVSTKSPPWERFGQELKALQAPDQASFHSGHREVDLQTMADNAVSAPAGLSN